MDKYDIVRIPIRWPDRILNAAQYSVEDIFAGVKLIVLAPLVFMRTIRVNERQFFVQKATPGQELSQNFVEDEPWKKEHDKLYGGDNG